MFRTTDKRNKMNQTDTPRTNAAINASGGQWSFVLLDCSSELERELTAVTEQRDEARRLAEKYRYLSCDSQEEADAEVLPWENNQQTEP
jgi:hypothetical protein